MLNQKSPNLYRYKYQRTFAYKALEKEEATGERLGFQGF